MGPWHNEHQGDGNIGGGGGWFINILTLLALLAFFRIIYGLVTGHL